MYDVFLTLLDGILHTDVVFKPVPLQKVFSYFKSVLEYSYIVEVATR